MEKVKVKATIGFAGIQTMSAGEERVVDREEYGELLEIGYVVEIGVVDIPDPDDKTDDPEKPKPKKKADNK